MRLFEGLHLLDSISLEAGLGEVLLLDWTEATAAVCENLVRIDAQGRVCWRLSPPDMPSCFTSISVLSDGMLKANSFNGLSVLIEPNSGKITSTAFAK